MIVLEAKEFLTKLRDNQYAYIFTQPIEEVITLCQNYTAVISKPIDLLKITDTLNKEKYSSLEELKKDIDLMITNCKTFNNNKKHWVYKTCAAFESFYNKEWKLLIQAAQKILNSGKLVQKQKIERANAMSNNINVNHPNNNSIQVVTNTDDDKIFKRIKNLFSKISNAIEVSESQRDEVITLITKSIVKRSKSFEQIYEDTMKFLAKNSKDEEMKTYFSKKFRKLLRTFKEEQNESLKPQEKMFNIKINLNETEEKKEENEKLEYIKKEVLNFVDNQKIPEVFRNPMEYPIEPALRKKINSYINEIRNNFMSQYN